MKRRDDIPEQRADGGLDDERTARERLANRMQHAHRGEDNGVSSSPSSEQRGTGAGLDDEKTARERLANRMQHEHRGGDS